MRTVYSRFAPLSLVLCLGFPQLASSQEISTPSLAGEWQLTTVWMGIASAERLQLSVSGNEIGGKLHRNGKDVPLVITLKSKGIRIEFKDGTEENVYVGKVADSGMSGNYTTKGETETDTGSWTAQRAPTGKPASPRTLDFAPTTFYRQLSANVEPVLRIWPGDIVRTKSVDAGGKDEKSVQRVVGGNLLTGPFYVEGAMPGDALVITIKRLRINRDWAMSDSGFVDRALTTDYASENKQEGKDTRWHLDAEKQVATLENASAHFKDFVVPLHPMLGCVGVAPGPWSAPIQTQDSGNFGGNMDFNGIAEGATLYLRVRQPGALLYLGDAHAVQGDGELNGNALETSMDIEFTVDLQREKRIGTPRVATCSCALPMRNTLATIQSLHWTHLQSSVRRGVRRTICRSYVRIRLLDVG